MAQVIVKTNWTKSAGAAKASIRYIEARPRGAEEPTRELWTKDSTISRADAYALIDAHHRHSVAAHRLILSPSADTPPDDLRRMTREVLGRLEAARGQTLHWVATEHRNTTHPHVHVILAGSGERNDQARAVRLTPRDLDQLREDGRAYCREYGRDGYHLDRAVDRECDELHAAELARAARSDDRAHADAHHREREHTRDRDDDWTP